MLDSTGVLGATIICRPDNILRVEDTTYHLSHLSFLTRDARKLERVAISKLTIKVTFENVFVVTITFL